MTRSLKEQSTAAPKKMDKTDIIAYPNLLPTTIPEPDPGDASWHTARGRLLGYLDALGIPPEEALDLSRQALDRARKTLATQANGAPVSEAVQAMRQILIEQNRIDLTGQNRAFRIDMLPVPATPEWNRGNMIPQKLEIAPWNSIAMRTRKFMSFRWVAPYVGLLILLVYAFMIF